MFAFNDVLVSVADKPNSPRNPALTEVDRASCTITWQPPLDDGGSKLTSYVIEKRDASRSTWVTAGSVEADVTSFRVGKLYEGNEYYIRVSAENKVGTSEPTDVKDVVQPKSPYSK